MEEESGHHTTGHPSDHVAELDCPDVVEEGGGTTAVTHVNGNSSMILSWSCLGTAEIYNISHIDDLTLSIDILCHKSQERK